MKQRGKSFAAGLLAAALCLLLGLCGCAKQDNAEPLNGGTLTFGESDPSVPNEFLNWSVITKDNQTAAEKGYNYASWNYVDFAGQSDAVAVSGRFDAELRFTMPEQLSENAVLLVEVTNSGYEVPDEESTYVFFSVAPFAGNLRICELKGAQLDYTKRWCGDGIAQRVKSDYFSSTPIPSSYAGKPVTISLSSSDGQSIAASIEVDGDKMLDDLVDTVVHSKRLPFENASIRLCGSNIELTNVTVAVENNIGKYAKTVQFAGGFALSILGVVLLVVVLLVLVAAGRSFAAWIDRVNDFVPFAILSNCSIVPTLFAFGLGAAAFFGTHLQDVDRVNHLLHRLAQVLDVKPPVLQASWLLPLMIGGLVVSGLMYLYTLWQCVGYFEHFLKINLALLLCGLCYGTAAALVLLVVWSVLGELVGLLAVLGFLLFASAMQDVKTEPSPEEAASASSGFDKRIVYGTNAQEELFLVSQTEDRAVYQDRHGRHVDVRRTGDAGEYELVDSHKRYHR